MRVSNGGITEARSFFEERLIFDSVNWNSSIVELNSDVFLEKWGIVGIFAGEKEIRRDASEFVRILILEKRLFGKNFEIVFKICDIYVHLVKNGNFVSFFLIPCSFDFS